MPRLTKRVVDGIRPDDLRDVFVWDTGDGALKGFGIRMKPSGIASFLIQYRNQEGRTRRMRIGRVGTLTPEEARIFAADMLREVARGNDPSAERHAARKAMTVAELCDWNLDDAKDHVKSSTLASDRSRIECHVRPLLGHRAVTGLKLADVEKMQADIAAGKTAKRRPANGRTGATMGGRSVASRTVGMLATILEHAKRHGIIENNPARGAHRFPDKRRMRFLSIGEITSLGEAMRGAEAEGKSRVGVAAVQALLLTGCRRNEILALPWSWFDASARCIRFGDTKSGAQIRPLGAAAAEFLSQQPNRDGSEWIFPASRGSGHFVGIPRVLADLCARAELGGVTPHVLRHSFASIAAELGFSELTIGGLLGHAVRSVTGRYAHVPDSALLGAADRVSARIAAALDGTPGADIIQLRGAR